MILLLAACKRGGDGEACIRRSGTICTIAGDGLRLRG
jgi:hypothetical protein